MIFFFVNLGITKAKAYGIDQQMDDTSYTQDHVTMCDSCTTDIELCSIDRLDKNLTAFP